MYKPSQEGHTSLMNKTPPTKKKQKNKKQKRFYYTYNKKYKRMLKKKINKKHFKAQRPATTQVEIGPVACLIQIRSRESWIRAFPIWSLKPYLESKHRKIKLQQPLHLSFFSFSFSFSFFFLICYRSSLERESTVAITVATPNIFHA